jgi:hypothetical protein
MSKATIFLANHGHLVAVGMERGSLPKIKALAQGEVFCTPNAKNFGIALATSISFNTYSMKMGMV